jgi:hypothetical protein
MKVKRIIMMIFVAAISRAGLLNAETETHRTIKKAVTKKSTAKKPAHKVETKKTVTHKKPAKKETKRETKVTQKKTTKKEAPKKPTKTMEAHNKVTKRTETKAVKPSAPSAEKRSLWSRMTGSPAATGAVAGTTAALATNKISRAIDTSDRKKAELDRSWDKKNTHRFHESTYNELVKDENLRKARINNGWHWLKLEEGKEGYSFYNPRCGWMYFNNATKEWYQPCKKRFVKILNFDL